MIATLVIDHMRACRGPQIQGYPRDSWSGNMARELHGTGPQIEVRTTLGLQEKESVGDDAWGSFR